MGTEATQLPAGRACVRVQVSPLSPHPSPPPLHPNGKSAWADEAVLGPQPAPSRINGYPGRYRGRLKDTGGKPRVLVQGPCAAGRHPEPRSSAGGSLRGWILGQGEQWAQQGPKGDRAWWLLPRRCRLRRGSVAQFPRKGGVAVGLLGVTTPRARQPCPGFLPERGG